MTLSTMLATITLYETSIISSLTVNDCEYQDPLIDLHNNNVENTFSLHRGSKKEKTMLQRKNQEGDIK